MTPTMEGILEAIREGFDDARWRTEAKIAQYLECEPDDPAFRALISSMLVSGFIHRRGGAINEGPNIVRATPLPPQFAGPSRRPHTGIAPVAEDKLRIAARIPLADDEKPAGSASVSDKEGAPACVAGVMTAAGPTVRLAAPIAQESKREWCGADDGTTIVLDDDGVDQLERAVESVIDAAEAAKDRFRELERETDRTRDARIAAEALRYNPELAGPAADDAARRRAAQEWAERLMGEQWQVTAERKRQVCRQEWLDPFVDRLDPDRRAAYDALEAEFQKHCNTPGDIGIEALGVAERARQDIRARQAEIVCPGITAAEVHRIYQINAGWKRLSYPAFMEQQREKDAILARADPPDENMRGRRNWLEGMLTHLSGEQSVDGYTYNATATERCARPVDDETMATVLAARAANDAADTAYDNVAGMPICTATVQGQWGSIEVKAVQGEEGAGHRYSVDMRPADDEHWVHGNNDSWRPTAGTLRRMVAIAKEMRDAATPPGYRRKPAGVPPA